MNTRAIVLTLMLLCFSLGVGAAALGGMNCDMWGQPPDPSLVKPRPIMLDLIGSDGKHVKFDITPEIATQIVDAQTPEFLFSRFYGKNVLRPRVAPPEKPKV